MSRLLVIKKNTSKKSEIEKLKANNKKQKFLLETKMSNRSGLIKGILELSIGFRKKILKL